MFVELLKELLRETHRAFSFQNKVRGHWFAGMPAVLLPGIFGTSHVVQASLSRNSRSCYHQLTELVKMFKADMLELWQKIYELPPARNLRVQKNHEASLYGFCFGRIKKIKSILGNSLPEKLGDLFSKITPILPIGEARSPRSLQEFFKNVHFVRKLSGLRNRTNIFQKVYGTPQGIQGNRTFWKCCEISLNFLVR